MAVSGAVAARRAGALHLQPQPRDNERERVRARALDRNVARRQGPETQPACWLCTHTHTESATGCAVLNSKVSAGSGTAAVARLLIPRIMSA